jgi:hypothetical protein
LLQFPLTILGILEEKPLVRIHVDLLTFSLDSLLCVVLSLAKTSTNDEAEGWLSTFELHKRDTLTSDYKSIRSVFVKIPLQDSARARTIAENGISSVQADQARVAAETLMANMNGNATVDEVQNAVVKIVRVE